MQKAVSDKDLEHLERQFNAAMQRVQKDLVTAQNQISSLNSSIRNQPINYGEIVNILDNSHPEYSHDAYTLTGVLPSTVSDGNRKTYNWFRHLSSVTLLTSTDADSLKATGHSLFAANENTDGDIPRWNLPDGEIELGSTDSGNQWELNYPLPYNLVSPGLTFYVQFEAMLRTSNPMPSNLQVFAAFFDNTVGQAKIIEGGNFTITGEIYGLQTGTRNVQYQVKAKTDSGEEAISNILNFANAPAVFSQENHPRINFRGAPGFIEFEIYRKDVATSTFVLQYVVRNSIDSTYFDVGNDPVRTVTAFPSATATPPRAYAKTNTFTPGTLANNEFIRHSLRILVPTTYDKTVTDPNSQWLKIGLTIPTDDERQIVLRRIGLSSGDGQWSRSPNDLRSGVHSTPTSNPQSGSQGGSGGGVGDPPPPGGGSCVLMTTNVNILKNSGQIDTITLAQLKELVEVDKEIIYLDSGAGSETIGGRVLSVKVGHVSRIIKLKTDSGKALGCTFDHPLITNYADIHGTPASKLNDQTVLTKHKGKTIHDKIVQFTIENGSFEVGIPVLEGNHIFVANDFLSHNAKPGGGLVN